MSNEFKVLITDDDKDIHEVLKSAFEYINKPKGDDLKADLLDLLNPEKEDDSPKVDLVHAYQGQDALEFLSEGGIDLLVLDMMMPPGINGAEVMSALEGKSKDLKIIISTAYFHDLEEDIRNSAKNFQEVYLLRKPYGLESFSNLVKNLLFQQENELNQKQILKIK